MINGIGRSKGLFPAHAGVILGTFAITTKRDTVPRTRGGDPGKIFNEPKLSCCSPHTRG